MEKDINELSKDKLELYLSNYLDKCDEIIEDEKGLTEIEDDLKSCYGIVERQEKQNNFILSKKRDEISNGYKERQKVKRGNVFNKIEKLNAKIKRVNKLRKMNLWIKSFLISLSIALMAFIFDCVYYGIAIGLTLITYPISSNLSEKISNIFYVNLEPIQWVVLLLIFGAVIGFVANIATRGKIYGKLSKLQIKRLNNKIQNYEKLANKEVSEYLEKDDNKALINERIKRNRELLEKAKDDFEKQHELLEDKKKSLQEQLNAHEEELDHQGELIPVAFKEDYENLDNILYFLENGEASNWKEALKVLRDYQNHQQILAEQQRQSEIAEQTRKDNEEHIRRSEEMQREHNTIMENEARKQTAEAINQSAELASQSSEQRDIHEDIKEIKDHYGHNDYR